MEKRNKQNSNKASTMNHTKTTPKFLRVCLYPANEPIMVRYRLNRRSIYIIYRTGYFCDRCGWELRREEHGTWNTHTTWYTHIWAMSYHTDVSVTQHVLIIYTRAPGIVYDNTTLNFRGAPYFFCGSPHEVLRSSIPHPQTDLSKLEVHPDEQICPPAGALGIKHIYSTKRKAFRRFLS